MARADEESQDEAREEQEGEEGEDEGYSASEALAEVLTNKHFLGTVEKSVDRICRAIDHKGREGRVQSARWARSLHDAMWLHFTLAVIALGAVVTLRLSDKMNDGTAATLLAGVVGSLFVKPRKESE